MSALFPSPYDGKSLQNFDMAKGIRPSVNLSLQPNRGGWIVSAGGEHLGTIKRTEQKGIVRWKVDGMYGVQGDDVHALTSGYKLHELQLAATLLEEYLREHAT